ncbi:leukocyte elastase inhibitor-like protein [Dinothrombium tinctorium]|uniref:Leukocyte elastase inhibitor-like protein n=1 Tax=Dinothrombium tinctorium TaxID=1965070 RepID=A0A3S3QFV8_9ACAR|nr:leukocyte elastase inhibitor-like protein [Dinothrombium tinctorium]
MLDAIGSEIALKQVATAESETKLNDAINYTINLNMHMLRLITKTGESFVSSPLALTTSLVSMVAAMEGEARSQLSKALFDLDEISNEEEYLMLLSMHFFLHSSLGDKNTNMKLKPYFFINENHTISPAYEKLFAQYLGGEIQITSNTGIDAQINQLVGSQLSVEMEIVGIDKYSDVFLIGLTSFTPLWKHAFERSEQFLQFYNEDSTVSSVAFLYGDGKFRFHQDKELKCAMIEMPLRWENTSVVFILPDEDIELSVLMESNFTSEMLKVCSLPLKDVRVWIPEFRVRTKINMKPFLCELGIDLLFNEEGKCSRVSEVSSANNLVLHDLIQICVLEVRANYLPKPKNEERVKGFEKFICNRPFLFAVIEEIEGTRVVLYYGIVNKIFED